MTGNICIFCEVILREEGIAKQKPLKKKNEREVKLKINNEWILGP
jgi:hypothetical protein